MAAHVVTALNEIKKDLQQGNPVQWDILNAALNLSCWTEDLDLDEYTALLVIVQKKYPMHLALLVGQCLEKYTNKWVLLGQPKTREEWLRTQEANRIHTTR
jgi:hypothetical protein